MAREYADRGYLAMKFGWGPIGREQRLDDKLVIAIRDAVVPELDVMIDAGQQWDVKGALRMAHVCAKQGVYWLEDPLFQDDLAGYRSHPHARATNKCFLAFTNPDEIGIFLGERDREALTHATITHWGVFLDALQRIRAPRYALDVEEFQEGVGCMSTVLLNGDGVAVGALGISVPVDRFGRSQETLIRAVLDADHKASTTVGFQSAYPPTPVDRADPEA